MRSLKLVITADDLGIDPRRDAGIFEAFAAGAITQASLMVGGRSAVSAAQTARAVGLAIGLHLDLTEMPSTAPASEVTSLLDAQGHKRGKHGLRAAVTRGEVESAHVAREAEAQLAAFAQLTGKPATHVDGHQHVHTVPALAPVLAAVFAKSGVRTTRIPSQRTVNVANPEAERFYRGVSDEAALARAVYERAGVRSTEAFVGLDLMGMAAEAGRLREALVALADAASLELMCHPGYVGSGLDEFNESPAREHELRVLCALPFATLIANGQIQLSHFEQLA